MLGLNKLCKYAIWRIKDKDRIYTEKKLLIDFDNIIRDVMNTSKIRKSLI